MLPTTVATMAKTAMAGPSSPWLQQAPTATDHRGRRGHPEGDRVLRGPRPVGLDDPLPEGHDDPRRRTASAASDGPAESAAPAGDPTARARRRPRSIRSRTDPYHVAVASTVTSTTGRPRARRCGDRGHDPLRLGLGGDRDRQGAPARRRPDRRSGAPSRVPSATRRGRWPASGRTGGCPRAGRGVRRGAHRRRTGSGAGRHRSSSRGGTAGDPVRRAAGPRAAAGGAAPTISRAHHNSPKGAQEATSTTTASMTPRRAGTKVTSTVRGPRTGPAARATGPTGCRGRMRTGRSASKVTRHRPTRPGRPMGWLVQVTPALRAGTIGATRPMTSTAASRAPTACTQPDPLEWATPAQASTATTLPTTGASQATGCSRARSRTPPGTRSGSERAGPAGATGRPRRRGRPASVADQPDGGPGHHDGGPEGGPDDEHDAPAGHDVTGGDRTDRAPQQRTAVGAASRLTWAERVSRRRSGRRAPDRRRRRPRRAAGGTGRPPPPPGRPRG